MSGAIKLKLRAYLALSAVNYAAGQMRDEVTPLRGAASRRNIDGGGHEEHFVGRRRRPREIQRFLSRAASGARIILAAASLVARRAPNCHTSGRGDKEHPLCGLVARAHTNSPVVG